MNRKSRCSFLGRKSITLWLTPHTLPQVDDVWYMNHHRTVAFFGPLTTRHLWFTVHIFENLPPFSCLFFYVWLWSSWCMQGGSIHWRTKEDKMYVYGLWIWPHDLRIQFFFLPCDPRRQFQRFCYSISYESPTLPQCSRTETEPGHQWVHAEWEWASVGLVRGNVIKFS